ncbi:MAG: NAD(P)/FAD-dependent oxidoreductase [Planctomycetota bacterium]
MSVEVAVIGGGLSGLCAVWQLHRHGVPATLLEARSRLGGRALSIEAEGGSFDMGPSWIWEGQPCVKALLEHFGIQTFPQYCDGALLHQSSSGKIIRNAILKPMQGSLRISGGIGRLVESLANEIPDESIRLDCRVTGLNWTPKGVTLAGIVCDGDFSLDAGRVALATPLRIAAAMKFTPPIEPKSLQVLNDTPTWMAGHAKFLAIYERPFWREQDLSGDVVSAKGPLAELHEATPESGSPHALLGFIGLNGESRQEISVGELEGLCLEHLTQLFGEAASSPVSTHIVDWSRDGFTATREDLTSYNHHPVYGVDLRLCSAWQDRIQFIVSETAFENGGLVEGAISNGLSYANRLLKQLDRKIDAIGTDEPCDPHAASMSWDWTVD